MARWQLRAGGVSEKAIDYRAANGRLHRRYQGVYLVGHEAPAPLALEWAAILACGEGAVISHCSAARIWSMVSESAEVHVTLIDRRLPSRPGLRIHRGAGLAPRDIRRRQALPVTSPARTLIDLAANKSPQLEHAFVEAHARRLVRPAELAGAIERAGPKAGVRTLRALIGANESGFTRSKAERKLRTLLRAARLPEPQVNPIVLGHMVDCLWPEQRLVVEFDGYGVHGHRRAFETDRRRDADLVAAGYRVMRITWLQLNLEPYAVLAKLASALATEPGREPH